MGVLNVTPDSFSDGGRFADADAAVGTRRRDGRGRAPRSSTWWRVDATGRGNRQPVDEELRRGRCPVIERLRSRTSAPISVDTSNPRVMTAAVAAGAEIINDVRALRRDGANSRPRLRPEPRWCLMHMQGEPATMQQRPAYADVVREVAGFLRERVACCRTCRHRSRTHLRRPRHRLRQDASRRTWRCSRASSLLSPAGVPVLIGVSRKSLVGIITGRATGSRATQPAAYWRRSASRAGPAIVRAHDVSATVDAAQGRRSALRAPRARCRERWDENTSARTACEAASASIR